MSPPFRLNTALNAGAISDTYDREGRVLIRNFLEEEGAWALHRYLRHAVDWTLVLNQSEQLFEFDRAAQQAMKPEERARLDAAIHAQARHGFQFCFENIRVPDLEDERRRSSNLLVDFATFLCSEAVMEFMRSAIGTVGVAFADAQATAYSPGHFLTAHHDQIEGKKRLAAYVFGVTPKWNVDWGGLLLFHRDPGRASEAFAPGFNTLSLFRVPQPHSVSMVTPFAASRRYSVTGWLRSCKPSLRPQGPNGRSNSP